MGLYQLDIMAGKGVCLNFSEMLKDLLNEYGFSSSTIINAASFKEVVTNYMPPITKHCIKPKSSTTIINKLMSSVFRNHGNHAFNLIMDDDKFYIYDTTNIMIIELENINSSKIIAGNGQFMLYPYLSYSLNYTKQDILLNTNNFNSPYDESTYVETWKNSIKKFNENIELISDYYIDTKENIDNVANKLILKK